MREKKNWVTVEREVILELKSEIRSLYDIFLGYFEKGFISISYEMKEGIDEEEVWESEKLKKLREFDNKKNINMSKMGQTILEKHEPLTLLRYKTSISNIENKYFKFLKPKEVMSIIKIQKLLTYLVNISNSAKVKHELFKLPKEHHEKNFCKYGLELFKEINYFDKNIINLFEVDYAKQ
jgi:hypothetical protein